MTRNTLRVLCALFVVVTLGLGSSLFSLALATEEENKDTRPERGITVAFEYPGVVINTGDDVTVDLVIANKGRRDETIYFTTTSSPTGWETKLKTYSFTVTSVYIPEDDDKTLQFSVKPPKDTKPGTYTISP